MSVIRFIGAAQAVAQVDKFTPASVETGDIFILTATGTDGRTAAISFTATADTVVNVTAGLTAAWNASTDALHTGITAADQTTYMKLTADTAGTGFTVAATTVNGGAVDDQTLTREVVTKNEGPYDWSSADNWSGGAVPGGAADQDVYVEGATILYGLDQSAIANALASLDISASQVGANPATGYLPVYLQIKAAAVNIGQHFGPGTVAEKTPINIDLGATASTVTIYNTGINSTQTMTAVRIKANNAATKINHLKGSLGVALGEGETTTVGEVNVSYVSQQTTDADCFIGDGVTLTTVNMTGGDVSLECAAATVNNEGGTLVTQGEGAITTLNARAGTTYPNSTGMITNLNITPAGTVDATKSRAARTVTNCKLEAGGTLKRDPNVFVITNGI